MQIRYLFHGTSEQAIQSIINSNTAGFQPLLSVTFGCVHAMHCSAAKFKYNVFNLMDAVGFREKSFYWVLEYTQVINSSFKLQE
jgi:hypothetical protein